MALFRIEEIYVQIVFANCRVKLLKVKYTFFLSLLYYSNGFSLYLYLTSSFLSYGSELNFLCRKIWDKSKMTSIVYL